MEKRPHRKVLLRASDPGGIATTTTLPKFQQTQKLKGDETFMKD
jgi:hypothetical protein